MALSFLPAVLENLNSLIQTELIQTEVRLLWGVDKEMKKLSSTLSAIVAVLEDAEEKQFKNKAIKDWLRKLKGVAYEVDDILDDFATEALRWKTKGQTSSSLKKVSTSVSYPFANIMFRHKTGNRMKEVTHNLSSIAEERKNFHLCEAVVGKQDKFADGRETGSIAQPEVYGREEEKQKIVKVLVEDTCQRDEVSVYPIIGMGGLGKTTLAQMVFNDEKVNSHFEPKNWVYISQDFDVKRVIKATLESATGKASDAVDLVSIQRGLRDLLNEKRYLIVLDDMWNDDQEKWDSLKCVLACGSKGASVIITTRLEKVSSIMGTIAPLHLSFLSDDFCWLLFRKRAFGHGNQERQNLVDIGKEIVKKCGGVPLAAKALGGLLHFKDEESEWNLVKQSEVWNLPHSENSILPALRLSYYDLSLELRRCFAYCAVFPKGSEMKKETLIHLWMANGYISCKGTLELEDIGDHTWNELCRRSFFQVEEKNSSTCLFKMHDLMHDLAQSVMEYECHIMENESSSCIPKHIIHHVTLLGDTKDTIFFPKSLQSIQSLRSILLKVKDQFSCSNDDASDSFSCDFSKFHLLRAFDAGGSRKLELSSSIGNLKHLRFLNFSGTRIQTLPKSICSLHNLQTLNLDYCCKLRMLPKKLKNLKSLRHLYLKECEKIHDMPPKLGQLTLLKTLSLFCASNNGNRTLAELQHLDLGGELCIKHLERVRNSRDAREANLVGKQKLRILKLEWSRNPNWESQANIEQLLEDLRPHHNVEELVIKNYKGAQFPLWMRDSTLKNVVSIELSNCSNCLLLPPFGRLPSLRRLKISGMEYFENDFPGGGPISEFPSLEELCIWDVPNLKAFSREERRYQFPRLRTISIRNCPKLTLPRLSSSETLTMVIDGCDLMLSSISNLNCLTSLKVSGNDDAVSLPEEMLQNLTSLESLTIYGFSKLKMLPANLSSLVSLKSLEIRNCHKLESLPESLGHLTALEELRLTYNPRLAAISESIKHLGSLRILLLGGTSTWESKALSEVLRHVTSLQSLSIWNYPELTSFPEWLGNFSSLQSLEIGNCPKIQSLPQSIQSLTKLKSLWISRCGPELERRCQKGSGEDWSKIAHIQNYTIYKGYAGQLLPTITIGADHVRVHPRFLHSNVTSHKWALGAFAELLDNSLDEVCNGATYVYVDMLKIKRDRNKMLLVEDNGGGMAPAKMRQCMSLGYSAKSKMANTIGQYGNGFKTSTMRLGADVIVFSRCPGVDGRSSTQSFGMLSYTFLRSTAKEDIVVPMIDSERSGQDWNKLMRSSPSDWNRNLETILRWSPYESEDDLLQQFNQLKDRGTHIIIYNLWEDDEGQLELDFDQDQSDIQIRGVNRDEKKKEMAKAYPNSKHFLTYRHSLRNYASILYLRIPPGFRMILQGKEIEHHNIVNNMMFTKAITYRPVAIADEMPKDQNMFAVVTLGFVKDAKYHIDSRGFNVYHKNRLIKPFWRVWNAAGSSGCGVIGVLEANFVEPAHDKQGFESTTALARLEARLVKIQKTYWSTNSHEIGYAKRRLSNKSASLERDYTPSDKGKSPALSYSRESIYSDGGSKVSFYFSPSNFASDGGSKQKETSDLNRRRL